jgi:hypothetical protein
MTQDESLIERLKVNCLGLDAVDPLRLLVDDVIAALAQRTEQNFCPRCGKRTNDIHTCTPPQRTEQEPVQVSPLEFVEMVMEKEHLIGKPIFWAEWPNKEKNNG